MLLTGTEEIFNDLWSTVIYDHASGQYTVTYATEVDESLIAEAWNHLPMKSLVVVEQYFDTDLNREVLILEREANA